MLRSYILNILIAIDQLLNTLIGGYPDETLSSSAYMGEQQGRLLACIARPVIDWLFYFVQKEHCKCSYEAELNGLQLPSSYRRANLYNLPNISKE